MDNIPDYQIEVNIYSMKHIRLFEDFRVGLTPDTEDTPENIIHKRAVIEDFCDKYDFKLITDYNCFEIKFRSPSRVDSNSTPISSKEFKSDLIKFFKKLSANHKREDVDRLDISILSKDKSLNVREFTNLFNKSDIEKLYQALDSCEWFYLISLTMSVRFTYRYY